MIENTEDLVERLRFIAESQRIDFGATRIAATLDEAADLLDTFRGYEREEDYEGGQPNGIGEIEPNWYRDWYSHDRESHRRHVITYTGPWEKK